MADYTPVSNNMPIDWLPITAGASRINDANGNPAVVKAIRANGAGTVTVTTIAGTSRVLNFAAGEMRLLMVTHVTAATATGLEGAI
jgi:hypothetical protein